MRTLGKLTALFLTAAAGAAVVVGVITAPDVKKYLRMRQM